MKFFAAVLFAVVALAAADVSHLNNKYLPPSQGVASTHVHYETAPAATFTSNQYVAPASTVTFSDNSLNAGSSYAVPESSASYTSFKTTEYQAPAASFSAPVGAASYVAPETTSLSTSYSAPVTTTYTSGSSYSAPQAAASVVDTQYAADGGYIY